MVLPNSTLETGRKWLYFVAIGLTAITFIVDCVALAAVSGGTYSTGYFSVYLEFPEHKGATGWTLFVTIVSLFLIPALAYGRVLANRGLKFADMLNRTFYELIIVTTLAVLWFVSAIVLAAYSGCIGGSICSKYRAATAFAWLLFFDLLALNIFTGIIFHKQKANGLDVKTAYTIDLDGQTGSLPPPGGVQNYSSYGSNPQVAMPQAGNH
ncbi:hypothetical protein GGI12_003914 [Dipsacomyces acuminosporus]|nr:hypothetical protein GGI12_003914 [Dipsacomyces acuminosporus]